MNCGHVTLPFCHLRPKKYFLSFLKPIPPYRASFDLRYELDFDNNEFRVCMYYMRGCVAVGFTTGPGIPIVVISIRTTKLVVFTGPMFIQSIFLQTAKKCQPVYSLPVSE